MSNTFIPTRLHVAKRESDNLAFVTPYGEDSAAKARIATANEWAGAGGKYSTIEKVLPHDRFFTIENDPMTGFVLTAQKSRSYTSNQVWQINDPRGFEFQIYSGNMYEILQEQGINNGVLNGSFVYGRQGAKNVLLPTDSDLYREAIAYSNDRLANKIGNTIPMNKVNPGDKVVVMHHGQRNEYFYLGLLYHISTYTEVESVNPFAALRDRFEPSKRVKFKYVHNICTKPVHTFFGAGRPTTSYYDMITIVKPNVMEIVKKDATGAEDMMRDISGAHEQRYNKRHGWSKEDMSGKPYLFGMSPDKSYLENLIAKKKVQLAASN